MPICIPITITRAEEITPPSEKVNTGSAAPVAGRAKLCIVPAAHSMPDISATQSPALRGIGSPSVAPRSVAIPNSPSKIAMTRDTVSRAPNKMRAAKVLQTGVR